MAITVWDITKYPKNWKKISLECRERSNNCCEICGIQKGEYRISKAGNSYKVSVSACHINPCDESNTTPELFTACFVCHARYDAFFKSLMIAALKRARKGSEHKNFDLIIQDVVTKFPKMTREQFLDLYEKKAA